MQKDGDLEPIDVTEELALEWRRPGLKCVRFGDGSSGKVPLYQCSWKGSKVYSSVSPNLCIQSLIGMIEGWPRDP